MSQIVALPWGQILDKPSTFAADIPGIELLEVMQQSVNSGSLWGPMDGAHIEFLGNTAYLFGGWNGAAANSDWTGGLVTNLVYRSTDFGVTWSKIRDHDLTPDSTHFVPGHALSRCKHTVSGTEYIYIMGGDTSDNGGGAGSLLHGDTRRSTDGITWAKVNSVVAGWQYISLSASGSLGGNLYRAGGVNSPGGTPNLVIANAVNSVWQSTDHGISWSNLGNAPWPAGMIQDRMPLFKDKLWRVGGGAYDDTPGLRTFDSGVWSFDGATWTEELADGLAPWAPRTFANVFVFDGWLYISRGYNVVTGNLDDTWRTRDGKHWIEVDLGFIASHADGLGVHATGFLIASGNGYLANNVNSNSPTYFVSPVPFSIADGIVQIIFDAQTDIVAANGIIYEGYTEGSSPRRIVAGTNAKIFQLRMPHRIDTEEPITLVGGYSYGADNIIFIGGGISNYENAATEINTYLAANTNTTAGTLAVRTRLTGKAIQGRLAVGSLTIPVAPNIFEVRNPTNDALIASVSPDGLAVDVIAGVTLTYTNINSNSISVYAASGGLTAGPFGSLKLGGASAAYLSGPSGQMIFGEDAGAFYVGVGFNGVTKPIYIGHADTTRIELGSPLVKIANMPTSNPGAGILWNDGGTVKMGT